jgi:uncharacterized protein (UPF0335 family)
MVMSLTYDDLQAIRNVVKEEMNPLSGEIEALSNDIKEIYSMIADAQKNASSNGSFDKLSLEKKMLQLHKQLVYAAEQAGIKLPSH